MTPYSDLIAFAVALLGSLGLTIPVRRLALHYGMVDRPGPRKVHLKPIPLLGGIAIYLGFVLAVLLTLRGAPQQQIAGILAGATLLATVGLLDDGGMLHHQVKLFIGMPAGACFLLASGIRAQFFSVFVHGTLGVVLDSCFTVFWVVGITAAFSILDHMDGLCAGIAAVAAAFFTISAAMNHHMMVQTLGAATLGAALGFLRWNFNPAKIFMGDGGAMFLGFLMATLGLKLRPQGTASRCPGSFRFLSSAYRSSIRRWFRFRARAGACCPLLRRERTTRRIDCRISGWAIAAPWWRSMVWRCSSDALAFSSHTFRRELRTSSRGL